MEPTNSIQHKTFQNEKINIKNIGSNDCIVIIHSM